MFRVCLFGFIPLLESNYLIQSMCSYRLTLNLSFLCRQEMTTRGGSGYNNSASQDQEGYDFRNLFRAVENITTVLKRQAAMDENLQQNNPQLRNVEFDKDYMRAFQRLKRSIFEGTRNPMLADQWISQVEKVFRAIKGPKF